MAEPGPDPKILTTNSMLSALAQASQPSLGEDEDSSSANSISGDNFSVCLFSMLLDFSEARE